MTYDPNQPRDAEGKWTRLAGSMKTSGGFTAMADGSVPTSGFSVGVPSKDGKDHRTLPYGSTTAEDIAKFAEDFKADLAGPRRGIGGWANDNPEWGEVRDALDIVEVHDTLDDALAAARRAGQDAIFDLGKGEEIPVPKKPKIEFGAEGAQGSFVRLGDRGYGYVRRARALETVNKAGGTWVAVSKYGGKRVPGNFKTRQAAAAALIASIDGKDHAMTNLSIYTPSYAGTYDLSVEDGKLAFWKQVLPKKAVHYTAKDGTRGVLNFDDRYLTDLANNEAVDQVAFLLADTDNRHTMDPERFRGTVAEWKMVEGQPNPDHDGLYAKIVFPNREAAKAVLDNPDLGVSARIREGIQRSDGSTVSRGIVHVLGTLDPQVSGMSGWQTADLSNEDDTLDLTDASYEDGQTMSDKHKSVTEYTEAEIEAMTEEELEAFLAAAEDEFSGILEEIEAEVLAEQEEEQPQMVSLSNEAKSEIDLANSRASRALAELAQARWEKTRDAYLGEGVPPALLDLAEPIFNRPAEFIVDLSNEGVDGEINVGEIVSRLLDAAKGTIDLSVEQGHGGTFKQGDGEDPDKQALDLWESQA